MHIHWAKEKYQAGQWRYHRCRCGAKKTTSRINYGGTVWSVGDMDWPWPNQGWVHKDFKRERFQAPEGLGFW